MLEISDSTISKNTSTADGAESGGLSIVGVDSTLTNDTIADNTATSTGSYDTLGGGARFTGGTISITATTFSGNAAISQIDSQGGCFLSEAPVTLANSTLTGNSTSATNASGVSIGGCIDNLGGITLINTTLAANTVTGAGGYLAGSNIRNHSNITAANSIIANGVGADDCAFDPTITLTDDGNNLESGTSCGFTGSGDLQNTDPKLGSLANYGGSTQTMALRTGSPAIDAGSDSTCTASPISGVDQRGVTRPQGTHCDIGAFEYVPLKASTTALDVAPNPATCGQLVTLTAIVTPLKGTTTPTGTVTFKDGSTTLTTATLSGNSATFSSSSLTGGDHSFTATYSGDSNYTGSTSPTISLAVNGCPTPTPKPTPTTGPTNGLDGIGPVAPPAIPQGPSRPRSNQGSSQGSNQGSSQGSKQGTNKGTTPSNTGGSGTTAPGFMLLPIVLFILLLLVVGGLLGVSYLRRQQSHL